ASRACRTRPSASTRWEARARRAEPMKHADPTENNEVAPTSDAAPDAREGESSWLDALQEQEAAYSGDEERPLGGYVRVMATYAAVVGGMGLVLRNRRLPERIDPQDIALVALATHKLSRLVSKDPVTSPLRAPFTRFRGVSGPSELREEVRGHGS